MHIFLKNLTISSLIQTVSIVQKFGILLVELTQVNGGSDTGTLVANTMKGAAAGMAAGAAAGCLVGSVAGPVGAAVGTLIGGGIGCMTGGWVGGHSTDSEQGAVSVAPTEGSTGATGSW